MKKSLFWIFCCVQLLSTAIVWADPAVSEFTISGDIKDSATYEVVDTAARLVIDSASWWPQDNDTEYSALAVAATTTVAGSTWYIVRQSAHVYDENAGIGDPNGTLRIRLYYRYAYDSASVNTAGWIEYASNADPPLIDGGVDGIHNQYDAAEVYFKDTGWDSKWVQFRFEVTNEDDSGVDPEDSVVILMGPTATHTPSPTPWDTPTPTWTHTPTMTSTSTPTEAPTLPPGVFTYTPTPTNTAIPTIAIPTAALPHVFTDGILESGVIRGNVAGANKIWDAKPNDVSEVIQGVTFYWEAGDRATTERTKDPSFVYVHDGTEWIPLLSIAYFSQLVTSYVEEAVEEISIAAGELHYGTAIASVTCGINCRAADLGVAATQVIEWVQGATGGGVTLPRRTWTCYQSPLGSATDSFKYYNEYTWFYPGEWVLIHLKFE